MNAKERGATATIPNAIFIPIGVEKMSEKIVDSRIKHIKKIKGKTNENLLAAYEQAVRNGAGYGNWHFEQYKKEILERMRQ